VVVVRVVRDNQQSEDEDEQKIPRHRTLKRKTVENEDDEHERDYDTPIRRYALPTPPLSRSCQLAADENASRCQVQISDQSFDIC
jgi:hypothetical protein